MTIQAVDFIALSSGSYTTTQVFNIQNIGYKYIHVILDMTNVTASPSVTVSISGVDPASGKSYAILNGSAITTAVTSVYKVGPGLPTTANVSANDVLPMNIRLTVTANNGNAGTYSLGYVLIP